MSRRFACCVLGLAVMLVASGSAASAQVRIMPSQGGNQTDIEQMRAIFLEHQQREAALAAIAQDRASFISSLLDRFTLEIAARDGNDRVRNGIAALLMGTDPEKLYRVSQAKTFGELQTLLVGKTAAGPAVSLAPGEVGPPDTLGSAGTDLVYYPVSPCRALDTRFAGPLYLGPWAANTSKDIMVTDPIQNSQGGLAACGIPLGPARAVVLNIAAVWPANAGYFRIYPYGETLPNASILNFAGGDVIANAVVAPICLFCAFDLTVRTDQSASHVVVDVLGYFAAPTATPLNVTKMTSSTSVPAATSINPLNSPACPAGTTLTGGGFNQLGSTTGFILWNSGPDPTNTFWVVRGFNNDVSSVSVFAYALCAQVPGR